MRQNMFAPTSSTGLESRDTLRNGRVPATKLRQSQMSSQKPKNSKRQVSQMSSNTLQEYFSCRPPSQALLSSFPQMNVSHSPTNLPTRKKTAKEHKSTHQKTQDPPPFSWTIYSQHHDPSKAPNKLLEAGMEASREVLGTWLLEEQSLLASAHSVDRSK